MRIKPARSRPNVRLPDPHAAVGEQEKAEGQEGRAPQCRGVFQEHPPHQIHNRDVTVQHDQSSRPHHARLMLPILGPVYSRLSGPPGEYTEEINNTHPANRVRTAHRDRRVPG